jgi:hypothetical protein
MLLLHLGYEEEVEEEEEEEEEGTYYLQPFYD